MSMEYIIPRIIEDITDRHRQEVSHQRLGANPSIIISVEGKQDKLWLKSIIAKQKGGRHITVRYEIKDGKQEVIKRVLDGESDYGIVDMDYDFSGSKISSPNIVDTRNYCCTFGIIFDNVCDVKFKSILIDSVDKSEKKNSKFI